MAKEYNQQDIDRARANAKKIQEVQAKFWRPLIGLAMIGLGVYLYIQLSDIEANGGSIKLHWLIYYAYKIGGKYLVSAILILIGAGITFSGVKDLLGKKKED